MSSEPAGDLTGQRASVLVATSDSATRDLLRRLLHVGAVEVIDAADGLEALTLARRLDLDLIVLDAFLAVMDGMTVCGRIRALTEIEQPPIIIVGLISERAVEVALSAGADESLSKPLNPAVIRNRVRVLLMRRQAEKRLSLLRRAFEMAPAGVTLLDARTSEYSVAFANTAFSQLSGYSTGEVVGHNLRLLIGPDTDVAAMTELRDAMAEGRPSRVLLRNYRKDGRPFWNDLASAPIQDAAGRLTHFVAVQHDVTHIVETPGHGTAKAVEEKVAARTRDLDATLVRVEARRRFTETILNSMVSAILATDVNGTVTFANLAALQTLGTSLADCVGRSVIELFGHHEGVAEVIRGAGPAMPEHRLDFPMISPGGARFYVGMSITPAPPALRDEVGFIFLFRNLAETIEDRAHATGSGEAPAEPPVQDPAGAASPAAEPAAATAGEPGDGHAAQQAGEEHGQRPLLTLRYSSVPELVRRTIDALAHERPKHEEFIHFEAVGDVPEILIDRQQVSEALVILLANTIEQCGAPAQMRVRVSRTDAAVEKTGHPSPAAQIEILHPRALITERDLGPGDSGANRRLRRTDWQTAEKLLEANGGRLILPARDDEEQRLTILLRAAR